MKQNDELKGAAMLDWKRLSLILMLSGAGLLAVGVITWAFQNPGLGERVLDQHYFIESGYIECLYSNKFDFQPRFTPTLGPFAGIKTCRHGFLLNPPMINLIGIAVGFIGAIIRYSIKRPEVEKQSADKKHRNERPDGQAMASTEQVGLPSKFAGETEGEYRARLARLGKTAE